MAAPSTPAQMSPRASKSTSAEARTGLLPGMPVAGQPPRPPQQLAFPMALGLSDDQLVMPGIPSGWH